MIGQSELEQAIAILRQGGLVAFPTETVYGLGADARNPLALRKVFAAKERPVDHPLIVHLADKTELSEWAVNVPASAWQLAEAFWPGPLTLILQKAPGVSDLVTGQQETIGLRVPNHPVAQALLQAFGSGLAAPSANRFGRISPTTAAAVAEELTDAVDFILDGGQCAVGVESTIVDMTGDYPAILRPGMITAAQIEKVLHQSVMLPTKQSPRVSGSLESHYAPRTPTRLISSIDIAGFLKNVNAADLPVAILTYNQSEVQKEGVEWIAMPNDANQYAHDLYQTLRMLDARGFRQLIVESVPEKAEWDAIRDRLQRASY